MLFQKYILPVFIGTNLLGQEHAPLFTEFNLGFTHSVYSSMCFKPATLLEPKQDRKLTKKKKDMAEVQYGFGIGFFLWIPLNKGLVYKPKLEGSFGTSCFKESKNIFATSFDVSITNSFALALKPADEHGTIYIARDMSCYLTSKQPYLLLGPKINLKKFDAGFIHKGFQNELSFGLLIGYGINYEFHGTNFAPEIIYSVTSTAQNKINDSRKIAHTITLALNFF